MELFHRNSRQSYVLEVVDSEKVTSTEAKIFLKLLEQDIYSGYKIILIDLSNCKVLDSAFVGVLVITLKKLMLVGGSLKIIKPDLFAGSPPTLTGSIELFEVYETVDKALSSIVADSAEKSSNSISGFEQLALAQ